MWLRGALAALATLVLAAPSGDEIALTLAQATEEMLRGVSAFVAEGQTAPPEPAKAMALARQMATNLQAMGQVARKVDGLLRARSGSADEQKVEQLLDEVAALKAVNHDLEGEKKSLIISVQNMLTTRPNKAQGELKDAQADVARLQKELAEAKSQTGEQAQQLEEANAMLTQRLTECQASPGMPDTGPSAQVAENALACERKLQEATAKAGEAEKQQAQMMDTVNMLMHSNEAMKEKAASAHNRTREVEAVKVAEKRMIAADVAAHMSETTKIDTYIARSGDMPAELKDAPMPQVTPAPVQMGADIARYLRGDKDA